MAGEVSSRGGASVAPATVSANRLTLSGSGVRPGTTFNVYDNGAALTTITAAADGTYSKTLGTALVPGHVITHDALPPFPSSIVGLAVLAISGANGTANVGDTASYTPTISGGTAPYTVAATGLPPGRSINNTATGLTTGAYTTAGSYNATYTVTDAAGATASLTRSVVVGAASVVVPSSDWRLPITAAYDSGGDTAFVTAVAASSTAKTLPTLTNNTPIPASTTRDISVKVGTVAAPGGLLYLDWAQTGTGLVSVTALESTDTSDGSAASGAWAANSFAPWKPSGDTSNTGYTGRGQLPRLAPGPERWVRLRIVTPASTTCLPYIGAFQLKADGSQALFAGPGMSIINSIMTSLTMRAAIQGVIPGSDPIWINTARAGADGQAIYNEQIVPFGNNAQLAGIKAFYLSGAINDMAYKGIRPYGSNPSGDALVGTNWQQNVNALIALVGAGNVYSPDVSFGRMLTSNGSNSAPFVDDDVNSGNGFLPYNQYQVGPRIKATLPKSWVAAYDWPAVSDYVGSPSDIPNYYSPNDDLHYGQSGSGAWRERLLPFIRQIYGLSPGDDTWQVLIKQAGSPTTTANKTKLQALYTATSTMYPTADSTAQANRSALNGYINNLPTTYADPAVTAPAILPADASISTGTLLAQFHAGDQSKFTRDFRGVVSALVDRKSGFTMAQTTYLSRPRLVPAFGGAKAGLETALAATPFEGRANTSLGSTDAALVGALNAAGQPYTLFGVITPAATNSLGGDIFGIGSASTNFLLVSLQPNSPVPRLLVGDGTGSAYSLTPTDAAISVGTRFAFAMRRDASGNLKYFRGGVTGTGTTARNAAVTGTSATLGRRAQGSGATFTGQTHELDLFTGAMSDAEIGNVLAGLQSAWGAI